MKKYMIKTIAWVIMLMPVWVLAKEYTAGKDYIELPAPIETQTGNKIEVMEFFWYGCSHCFQFDPKLDEWVKKLPSYAQFVRVPSLNPKAMVHTKTYYALESMGKGEAYHSDIFNALHVQRLKLHDPESIAEFLATKGVDKKAFLDAFNSFAVEMRARKAHQLEQSYRLSGVPMLTINGKYVVTTEKAGSHEGMLAVSQYLIEKEHKAASK